MLRPLRLAPDQNPSPQRRSQFSNRLFPGDFIVGTGEWRLDAAPGGTRMAYEIDAVATGRLAVLLGWLLPLGKIHSKFMREVLVRLEAAVRRRKIGSALALRTYCFSSR